MCSRNKDAGHSEPRVLSIIFKFCADSLTVHAHLPARARQADVSMFQFGDRRVVQAGWQQTQHLDAKCRHQQRNRDPAQAQEELRHARRIRVHFAIKETARLIQPREHVQRKCLRTDDGDIHLRNTAQNDECTRNHDPGTLFAQACSAESPAVPRNQ